MTDRYAKLKYESYRMGYHEDRPEQSTAQKTETDARNNKEATDKLTAPLEDGSKGHMNPRQSEDVKPFKFDVPASSLDTSRLLEIFKAAEPSGASSKLSKTMTVHTSRLKEPPLPKFEPSVDYVTCRFCFQVISRSLVRQKESGDMEWSDEGR